MGRYTHVTWCLAMHTVLILELLFLPRKKSHAMTINHFTVICSVTSPLIESEAGGDLVCFCFANQVVLMLTSLHFNERSRVVYVKD